MIGVAAEFSSRLSAWSQALDEGGIHSRLMSLNLQILDFIHRDSLYPTFSRGGIAIIKNVSISSCTA